VSAIYVSEGAHTPSRAEYWQRIIDETLVPLRRRDDTGDEFRSRLLTGTVGALRVTEMTTSAGECFRTPKLVRPVDANRYQIEVLAHGEVSVEQAGRAIRLRAGDIVVVDPSRPIRYAHSATRHVAMLFPRAMLPVPPDKVLSHAPIHIPGEVGTAALVSALARELPRHFDNYRAAEAAQLGAAVVDLLGVALAAHLDQGEAFSAENRQAALLQRVYAFIDEHLGDAALAPATVAGAHHISVRYLHRLFETQDVTVTDWIRQRRLDRCRRDLLNPALRARPVNAIGARWGWTNAAHFSRAFKAAYGLPPGEYRTLAEPR
jgi:AraC-like DNA-binding protein